MVHIRENADLQHIFEFCVQGTDHKSSVNLKYIMVGQLDDHMIVQPSDGAMFILIDFLTTSLHKNSQKLLET